MSNDMPERGMGSQSQFYFGVCSMYSSLMNIREPWVWVQYECSWRWRDSNRSFTKGRSWAHNTIRQRNRKQASPGKSLRLTIICGLIVCKRTWASCHEIHWSRMGEIWYLPSSLKPFGFGYSIWDEQYSLKF